MSVTAPARAWSQSTWLQWLTRAGFAGYGLTHLLLAWIALQIASSKPAVDADQSGAFKLLAGSTLGQALIVLIALGFAVMALWQALLAVSGHREHHGNRRIFEKVTSAGRTILYVYLGWTAWKVVTGASAGGDAQQKQAAGLMGQPNGTVIVFIMGALLACLGAGLAIYGWRRMFMRHLRTTELSHRERRLSSWLGVTGYLAKGVAYGVAGVLLTVAASTYDPEKARGLDAALRTLAQQTHGRMLLAVVAIGLAAFAAFCFGQMRYRKV